MAPPPSPSLVDELIEAVRRLDSMRQARAKALAHLARIDEQIADIQADLATVLRAGAAIGSEEPHEDEADETDPAPRGKAGTIYTMIRDGNFTILGACMSLYGSDDPEHRKNVRSALRYLEERLKIIRRVGPGIDEWEVNP